MPKKQRTARSSLVAETDIHQRNIYIKECLGVESAHAQTGESAITKTGLSYWLQRKLSAWLQELDITYEVIEVAPTRAQKQVVTTLAAEQDKLELKLERLRSQVHDQITEWAINDERRADNAASYCAGAEVYAPGGNVRSIKAGSSGFCNTSVGSSIRRRQKRQR